MTVKDYYKLMDFLSDYSNIGKYDDGQCFISCAQCDKEFVDDAKMETVLAHLREEHDLVP